MTARALPPLPSLPPLEGEVRICIVERHTIYAHGLDCLVRSIPNVTVSGIFPNADSALAEFDRLAPHLLILDFGIAEKGFQVLEGILRAAPRVRILVVSIDSRIPLALRTLRFGARGFLKKEEATPQVIAALQRVIAGEIYLDPALQSGAVFQALYDDQSGLRAKLDSFTPREMEIFRTLGHGLSTIEIARVLSLSVKTVETHRVHICAKLGIESSAQLSRFATDWFSIQAPLDTPSPKVTSPSLTPRF